MKRNATVRSRLARGSQRGFTLLEALVGIAILLVVMAAVFAQIQKLQLNSNSEALKMDLTQESREFIDQIIRDLHMAGYPKSTMYTGLTNTSKYVAAGLVRVSPTEILFEGDVDISGTVSSVDITYEATDPNDPNCPCVRRRSTAKVDGVNPWQQNTGTYYVEVEQVLPPGTGAGQSGEDLFTFYDKNGNKITIAAAGIDISTPSNKATIQSIQTIKINLSTLSQNRDPLTRQQQRISMSVTGSLNNK